jgi:ABC-type amino acid transport substrate-binding protein/mono/diheme cytochrome c family protein
MMPTRLPSKPAADQRYAGIIPDLRAALLLPLGFFFLLQSPPARADDAAPLRLCADPTNPPFSSNRASEPGIYMEVGAAIAAALHRSTEPVWEMTYYGKHATRETLLSGKCDMFVGLPANPGFMGPSLIRSHPFLQVGFALMTPKTQAAPSLAALHGKRVAVQLGTPPQSLLAGQDKITSTTFLDPETAVQAVASGQADAAFVWGPSAGYLNHSKLHDAYSVTPIAGDGMQYQVAIGFARKEAALRDQVDQVLPGLAPAITALAAKYGFPAAPPVTLAWAAPASSMDKLPIVRVADTTAAAPPATSDDQQSAADFVAPNRTPADASFKPATGPTAVAEGRTIFNGTCNHCHGPDAIQAVRKINLRLLHHRYGGAMDQVFHFTVTHGREAKGMPNWSGVFTDDDFAKILAFLHSVQEDTSAQN